MTLIPFHIHDHDYVRLWSMLYSRGEYVHYGKLDTIPSLHMNLCSSMHFMGNGLVDGIHSCCLWSWTVRSWSNDISYNYVFLDSFCQISIQVNWFRSKIWNYLIVKSNFESHIRSNEFGVKVYIGLDNFPFWTLILKWSYI
jgi:hypothetical protein